MTPERAREIRYEIDQKNSIFPKHQYPSETPEEQAEIMALWKTMPGYTCYYDAVLRIEKGINK